MELAVPTGFDERDWDDEDSFEPMRFAIIGLGWFGPDVAMPAIEESDYCQSTVTVSSSKEKAQEVAAEHGADHGLTYEEYHDGVAADAYDAVYIVTPNATHLEYAETAAELGKAVLCEKPLEATAERARALVRACDAAGVPLMTAYRMQTTRSVRWMRDRIQDGVIGVPVQIHSEFCFPMFPGGDPDQWRLDADLAGGGALMDIGVYPMNTARFLLDADPVAVQAVTTGSRPEFEEVDEHVAFQMEFPDDVTASCTASYNAFGANRMEVLGTEGRIVAEPIFDVDVDREIVVEQYGGRTVVDSDEPSEMVEEFDFFARKVHDDEPIGPDGHHGVVDVEIAEAVYESHETGNRIDL